MLVSSFVKKAWLRSRRACIRACRQAGTGRPVGSNDNKHHQSRGKAQQTRVAPPVSSPYDTSLHLLGDTYGVQGLQLRGYILAATHHITEENHQPQGFILAAPCVCIYHAMRIDNNNNNNREKLKFTTKNADGRPTGGGDRYDAIKEDHCCLYKYRLQE